MDFVFTETFYTVYANLDDDRVVVVDEIIKRLLIDHGSGWARQGKIEGNRGGSWIITMTGLDFEVALYWDYRNDDEVILVALVVRDL
ncbi:MAG: hypothetical protein ACRDWS_03840 [Acidimicrobiia bacterium]